MTDQRVKTWQPIGALLTIIGGLLLAGAILRRWMKNNRKPAKFRSMPHLQVDGLSRQIKGLTEEQAAALLPSSTQETDQKYKRRKFLLWAIRQNLFTIFNFNIFAMLAVNLLLDNPTGVILNLILLALNLTLRVLQVSFTKRRMDEILQTLQPSAAVIRDGHLNSIDPSQIAPGDILVINQGDEILVDGEMIGEGEITIESEITFGEVNQTQKYPGDELQAGSYCVKGRGVYCSKEGGWQRHRNDEGYQLELMQGERTSLQRMIENILRILFGIMVTFLSLTLLDKVFNPIDLDYAAYRDSFSVIFGVAPTSLFMVLILKNIVGVYRVSLRGALVYDPRSIETLAQVKTVCISKSSLVKGVNVVVESVESLDGEHMLSDNLIRNILGDIVHSTSITTLPIQMLAEALPGERRIVKERASFWQSRGWYGVTFADPDRQGTYILGSTEILDPQLIKEKVSIGERVERSVVGARRSVGKLLLSISRRTEEHVDESENDSEAETGTASDPQAEKPEMDVDHEKPTLRQRLGKTLVSWLTPIEELQRTQEESSEQPENEPAILLAYLPEPITLYDQGGMPVLPDDLIPLAKVQISEVVRTEARQTLKALLDAGMQIKILAADPPERVSLTVEELGVQSDKLSLVSGSDLLQLRDPAQTIQDTLIFGSLTPAMKAEIVKSLQSQDEHVMVIGSKVSDVPALRQANLATVPKNGVPAAMRLTDIVLLDDSIHVLPGVLSTGQQMISGVLTTFKLYLSQVIMQLILILLMTLNILQHFPYRPVQASVASVFTITIPNIFLVVWASSKRLTEKSIRRQLTRFITPVTLALTALVYGLFLFFSETSNDLEYARLAVTYGLLLAGWLRVLFVQPPTRFWAGGAPLRGDPRIFRVVIFCVLLLIGILLIPFFNDRFYITLLASWRDFAIVALAVIGWAMILKIIWRLNRHAE